MDKEIAGTPTWHERAALPAGAELEATLEDVSRADAPAEVIGRTRIGSPGNPPIAFAIPYDEDRIDPRRRYAVRARVTLDDALLFTTDTHYPALGPDQASHVELMLRNVAATPPAAPAVAPQAAAALENTYWKLMRIGTQPAVVYDFKREPHFVLHPPDGRVAGSGGCNRLVGSYSIDDNRISFGQVAGTMMACPQGMEQEQAFHQALISAVRWEITGETLQLFDADGASVAVIETRYLK